MYACFSSSFMAEWRLGKSMRLYSDQFIFTETDQRQGRCGRPRWKENSETVTVQTRLVDGGIVAYNVKKTAPLSEITGPVKSVGRIIRTKIN
jgi:hypothetical protein